MPIRRLSHEQFHEALPVLALLDLPIGEEIEWYADDDGSILGTVAEGASRFDWHYVIWKREKPGRFRVCEMKNQFASRQAAMIELLAVMETTERTSGRLAPPRLTANRSR